MPVADSQKELRFTRGRQGAIFAILSGMMLMAGLVFLLLIPERPHHPALPHPAWGLIPLVVSGVAAKVALHCAKHAYLLFSPVGIEIFPFFRPASGMQVIPWAQIAEVEIDSTRLTLHFTKERTAGVHLSLAPISLPKRALLQAAIEGRFSAR